jgi:hypothetical protein
MPTDSRPPLAAPVDRSLGTDGGHHSHEPLARRGLAAALAGLVPVATVGVLLLTENPGTEVRRGAEPTSAPLTRVDLACPAAATGEGVRIATTGKAGGRVQLVDLSAEAGKVRRQSIEVAKVSTAVTGDAPVLVTAEGELAPGVVAARATSRQLAATTCTPARPEVWFTGLGARADHASVLEVANPDVSAAIVDIRVLTRRGETAVADLRGVRVPGRQLVRVNLAEIAPEREEIAVGVTASRGRAAASVVDEYELIGEGPRTLEWSPGQAEPVTTGFLLGVPGGSGERTLHLANPGASEARVSLSIVGKASTFAPAGVAEVSVRAGRHVVVPLGKLLSREVKKGAVGVRVRASEPVTATMSSYGGKDLTLTGMATPIAESAATLVPSGGTPSLVLAGAEGGSAMVTVIARDDKGRSLDVPRRTLKPGAAAVIALPRGTAVIEVGVTGAKARAAVLIDGSRGAAVIPLAETQRLGLVPDVRPALP